MTRPEIEKVINTKKKLASTTILSLLTRLESKNFVEVTKQGKLNLYTPLVSQSDYQAHESQSVLEKLYGNYNCCNNIQFQNMQNKNLHNLLFLPVFQLLKKIAEFMNFFRTDFFPLIK